MTLGRRSADEPGQGRLAVRLNVHSLARQLGYLAVNASGGTRRGWMWMERSHALLPPRISGMCPQVGDSAVNEQLISSLNGTAHFTSRLGGQRGEQRDVEYLAVVQGATARAAARGQVGKAAFSPRAARTLLLDMRVILIDPQRVDAGGSGRQVSA
jgi:hypothetical protein